jgi:hypothetical protein
VPNHGHGPIKPEDLAIRQLRRIAEASERQAEASERTASAQEELVEIGRKSLLNPVVDFQLNQITRRNNNMIHGVVPGATGTFDISYVPATNFAPLSEGPTASTDDPDVTLSEVAVSPDTGLPSFDATLTETAAGENFSVTIDGVNDKGTPVTHTFVIPILVGPPPEPQSIVDFDLNQRVFPTPLAARAAKAPAKAVPPRRR